MMSDVSQSKGAVLFVVFNRPATTERVFEAIRRARPPRLYVAADGPRPFRSGEADACREVRRIASSVDWPCQLKTLYRDVNLGCKKGVSTAIDWFFSEEEEGIILEDDCVPSTSFFRYAEELLIRYRDDERVTTISAQHFHGRAHQPTHSYFYSRYGHCWGWATWRRAWQDYDGDLSLWPALRGTDWLRHLGGGSRSFERYWSGIFDSCHAGSIDTWDYPWTFSCWTQNGLSILPRRNLVTNIGFGEGATHTTNREDQWASLPLEELEFPLEHPSGKIRDTFADSWADRHVYRIPRGPALPRKVLRVGRDHLRRLLKPRNQ